MRVLLTPDGQKLVRNYLEGTWGMELVSKKGVMVALVDTIVALIEAHVRLGVPTIWRAIGLDHEIHELTLQENIHFRIVPPSRSFVELIENIKDYLEAEQLSWGALQSPEQIIKDLGVTYYDGSISWDNAKELIETAIVMNDHHPVTSELEHARISSENGPVPSLN